MQAILGLFCLSGEFQILRLVCRETVAYKVLMHAMIPEQNSPGKMCTHSNELQIFLEGTDMLDHLYWLILSAVEFSDQKCEKSLTIHFISAASGLLRTRDPWLTSKLTECDEQHTRFSVLGFQSQWNQTSMKYSYPPPWHILLLHIITMETAKWIKSDINKKILNPKLSKGTSSPLDLCMCQVCWRNIVQFSRSAPQTRITTIFSLSQSRCHGNWEN